MHIHNTSRPAARSRRTRYLWAVLAALLLLALLTLYMAIPRAASLTKPYRWTHIPLGHPRSLLHQYLGAAATPDSVYSQTHQDEWITYRSKGQFRLQVQYNANSIATGYKLWFTYRLGFFKKEYLLVTGQWRQ